jgi:hypothetical protein
MTQGLPIMKRLTKAIFASTALLSLAMVAPAKAASDYPFAATGHVGGGVWFSDTTSGGGVLIIGDTDIEVARIVGGGDFVVPIDGYWNAQFGGAIDVDHGHFDGPFGGSFTDIQGHFNTIGFWRSQDAGVFGLELGILGGRNGFRNEKYVKAGGVAEYFFGDSATVGVFGGVLVPFGRGLEPLETGYYVGGDATYYASETVALAAFGRYAQTGLRNRGGAGGGIDNERLTVGGKVRYLTSVPGLELYASGAYSKCEFTFIGGPGGSGGFFRNEGAEILAGVQVRLGGNTDSLVSIDRSNALDTRAWTCRTLD